MLWHSPQGTSATARKENMIMDDTVFYNVQSSPFRVYGLSFNGECYHRCPIEVAQNTNDGVKGLNFNTAGGRVRFVTDSPYIRLRATLNGQGKMQHFALTGSAGFDLYTGEKRLSRYQGTFIPQFDEDAVEGEIWLDTCGEQLITVNFPTYSGVKKAEIGLKPGASLKAAPDYSLSGRVVYYGSSITQGGCCSRPGNTYQAILTARLDIDHLNLGFSGSAKGEPAMRDYIAGLDMRAFVLDYDHNAPDVEHLRRTHEPLYQAVRKAHPDLPILMLTRPKVHLTEDEKQRKAVVESTYRHALAAGDRFVYFIPGDLLIAPTAIEHATVDNCHPNDIGFLCMANAIEPVLRRMLNA